MAAPETGLVAFSSASVRHTKSAITIPLPSALGTHASACAGISTYCAVVSTLSGAPTGKMGTASTYVSTSSHPTGCGARACAGRMGGGLAGAGGGRIGLGASPVSDS